MFVPLSNCCSIFSCMVHLFMFTAKDFRVGYWGKNFTHMLQPPPPPQITVPPTLFISIHMSSSLLFLLSLLSPSCKLFTAEAQHEVWCLLVKRMMGQEGVSPCLQTMEEMLLTQPFLVFCWVFIIVRWGLRNRCDKFLIFDEPSKQGCKCFCVFTYPGC